MKTVTVLGQPSWPVRASTVEAWLTRLGGHLGPVAFRVGRKIVRPYAVAPWAEEQVAPSTPAILRALRGDFFCLPFGREGPPRHRGERHPLHGDTSNSAWRRPRLIAGEDRVMLRADLALAFRPGRVRKEITLRNGHSAVYSRHVISGLRGPVTYAHHPCLAFPPEAGGGLISTSGFTFGQVLPGGPAGDRSALKAGACFRSLGRVPRRGGGAANLGRYPARIGYEDLVQLATKPEGAFAWTAVAFPAAGYAWFTLKDPRILPSTLLWFSNGGVDAPPFSGRHRRVLGVEDLCSYFAAGVAGSMGRNAFSRRGVRTCATLAPGATLDVRTIAGVVAIPRGFGRVARIEPRPGGIRLISARGRRVRCALDPGFLGTSATAAP